MISWTSIADFVEPNWDADPAAGPPMLFWRPAKNAATFGYIRDGELFDANWLYVCDANKVSHFCKINPPA